MVIISEETRVPLSAGRPQSLGDLFRLVAGGFPVESEIIMQVRECARSAQLNTFNSETVDQAEGYAHKVNLEPDELLVWTYGVLRENSLPLQLHKREKEGERVLSVNSLCDQRIFAFALLVWEKLEEFKLFVDSYPNIFGVNV